MGLRELLEKVREIRARRQEEPHVDLPDDMTRDKYLRSLRRERRTQMEVLEKRQLKQEIQEFRKNEERDNLWGVKGEHKPIVHQDFNILNGRGPKIMRQRMKFL